MLPDLHTDFSGGRSGCLVFPSLEEFSTVCCDPHSQSFGIVNKAEVDVANLTFQIGREKINHLISKLRQMANHLEK